MATGQGVDRSPHERRPPRLWLATMHAWFDSSVSDARVSLRVFRRSPAFVLTFALTLAVATAAFATVYSAANWVLLRPVPGVRGGDRLITMRLGPTFSRASHSSWGISEPDLVTLRERMTPLEDLAAMTPEEVDIQVRRAPPRRIAAEIVTGNYLHILGARLLAGRAFGAEDEADLVPRTMVLSYGFARTIAENPTSIIGTDIRVNGALLRVVGITEPGFRGAQLPGRPLLWLPASAISLVDPSARRDARGDRMFPVWKRMIGRLASGASPAQVEAAADAVMESVRKEFARNSYASTFLTFQVFPGVGLDPAVRLSARHTLAMLIGAATCLLCLAIANLTNLAFSHILARRRAIALRIALGATRARAARELVVEALVLGACGSGVALALTMAWGRWFGGTQLSEFGASLQGMGVDARVAGFVTATSFIATFIAFLQPGLVTRWRPLEYLVRHTDSAWDGHGLRSILVTVQVALSVVLLVGAMLLGRTVLNLRHVDLGFSLADLFTIEADPHLHGYDAARTVRLAEVLEDRLRAEPGIAATGLVSPTPLRSQYDIAWLQRRPGDTQRHEDVTGAGYYVSPSFLQTLGVRVLAGDSAWHADSGTVVITREALRRLYPGFSPASAVGRTAFGPKDVPLRIAAVVADVRLSDLTKKPPPTVFRPLRERPPDEPLSIYVRATGGSAQTVAEVERAMMRLAPDVPVYGARSARAAVDQQFAEQQVMAIIASALGALGVALAAIGLYGVLATVVAARQREIAIRAALGAGPGAIVRHVLARGLLPVTMGAVVGTAGAIAVSRLFASKLFDLGTLDPASYGLGLITMAVAALLACLPPAYRASRVSIVRMLRAE